MKISKVEYCNFRNFKDSGSIDCSTDGKVTIIYGVNGSGKTTFHQLFQWIIYGKTTFNKTASDKMYNLKFEYDEPVNSEFTVYGTIHFEHNGESYRMHREWKYRKTVVETRKIGESFNVLKKTKDLDWLKLDRPQEVINDMLPPGLSEYFFFDGEGMITDLKTKGKDSAKSLRDALYMMLDLNVYSRAIDYIGKTDLKTTVLGTLFSEKTSFGCSDELKKLGLQMNAAQLNRDNLQDSRDDLISRKKANSARIKEISELIGKSGKTQQEYTRQRDLLKKLQTSKFDMANKEYENFGNEMVVSFPKLLMSKSIERASKKLREQSGKSNLPNGINTDLVDALLKSETCICGNKITEVEKQKLKELYKYLPPLGYDSLYNNFTNTARIWGKQYSREKIEKIIENATKYLDDARDIDNQIRELDEKMLIDKNNEALIIERNKKEEENEEFEEALSKIEGELSIANRLIEKLEKAINDNSSKEESNKVLQRKIDIMEAVRTFFSDKLQLKSIEYSNKLESIIQELLDKMLEAKRHVTVSNDFLLKVVDSYDDEAKSEGQFATVSFAYIGGIFRLLKEENILSNKEYPLVLDAPFSKLGDTPRQKVVDTIPDYAPQIILFSKDNLQDVFSNNQIGNVYTITSNEEQNVSKVERGFLWK